MPFPRNIFSHPDSVVPRPDSSNPNCGWVGLPHRRRFLTACASAVAGSVAARLVGDDQLRPDKNAEPKTIEIDIDHGGAPQSEQEGAAVAGNLVRVKRPREIVCLVQQQIIGVEMSIHALLVPPAVHLDLQGSTRQLDCRSNCYGVRLSNDASIKNGS